jgi:Branched-chain amino acid aminotransferase/4-amino-4-deoxychorismate lyase
MEFLVFNGKYFNEGAALVSANCRGLRFGDGLFETMKSINGQIEMIDEHFARLWKGLGILQFKIPAHFTPDTLQEEVIALLQKNGHLQNARIRITLFRGDGGLYDAISHIPNYLVQTWALPADKDTWNSNGLILGIYTEVKKSCDILSNLKHNNFLPYSMAALHAKSQKWNDAVLLNTHGRICDSTIANIFLIKHGIIYTPALEEGCIAGVMRRHIIKQLVELGYKVEQARIT